MKQIFLILVVVIISFLASCDVLLGSDASDIVVTSVGETVILDSWSYSEAIGGEIDHSIEGSVIYTTNYLENTKTITTNGVVTSVEDIEGTIKSYTIVIDFYTNGGEFFGTEYIYQTTPLLHGDTHLNVVLFPINATESDKNAPKFTVTLTDIIVSYEGVDEFVYVDDQTPLENVEAFYVYFQALSNLRYSD